MKGLVVVMAIVCGCGLVDEPPPADHGAQSDAGAPVECRKPWAGVAPSACVTSDDCSWSQCSDSECVDGVCVHVKLPDGTACSAPELGSVGECRECLCTIET
jgi:hypothetical protein